MSKKVTPEERSSSRSRRHEHALDIRLSTPTCAGRRDAHKRRCDLVYWQDEVDRTRCNRRARHIEVARRPLILRDDHATTRSNGLDTIGAVSAIAGQNDTDCAFAVDVGSGFEEGVADDNT